MKWWQRRGSGIRKVEVPRCRRLRGFARLGLRLIFVLAATRMLGPGRFGVYVPVLVMVAVAGGSRLIDYLTRERAKDERLGWRAAVEPMLLGRGMRFGTRPKPVIEGS